MDRPGRHRDSITGVPCAVWPSADPVFPVVSANLAKNKRTIMKKTIAAMAAALALFSGLSFADPNPDKVSANAGPNCNPTVPRLQHKIAQNRRLADQYTAQAERILLRAEKNAVGIQNRAAKRIERAAAAEQDIRVRADARSRSVINSAQNQAEALKTKAIKAATAAQEAQAELDSFSPTCVYRPVAKKHRRYYRPGRRSNIHYYSDIEHVQADLERLDVEIQTQRILGNAKNARKLKRIQNEKKRQYAMLKNRVVSVH